MRYWNYSESRKIVIYPLIFLFVLMPLLTSCSSSSDTEDAPSGTQSATVESAVNDQNRSSQTAISEATDMAAAFDAGSALIDAAFGDPEPSAQDIEDFVTNNPDEAAVLIDQFETLAVEVQVATEKFSAAIDELKQQESDLENLLGANLDATAGGVDRNAQEFFSLTTAAVVLTVFGLVAAAGKGASDAMQACSHLPEDTTVEIAAKLECTLKAWPGAAANVARATVSTAATSVAGWASGVANLKKIKFIIDSYGTYDSVDSIRKAFGIKRCDQSGDSSLNRQSLAFETDNLGPGDVYMGTSDDDGVFHSVPEGHWTFLLIEDGHLRKVSQCLDCLGQSPIEAHVTLIPIQALLDDDTSVSSDTILTATVSIPGYGTFSPNFQAAGLGSCSETPDSIPAIFASSGGKTPDVLNSDILSIFLNNDLSIGVWQAPGSGPCDFPDINFSTKDIRNESDSVPVVFSAYSGTINIQEYGTGYGDRLKGSFNLQVVGDQTLCPTSECDGLREITGTITGDFDGVIAAQ